MPARRDGPQTDRIAVAHERSPWQRDDLSAQLEVLRYVVGFGVRSLMRRPGLVALGCVVSLAFGSFALEVVPKTYRVQTRILTHPTFVLPNLAHPERRIPHVAEDGTRGAVETIKSREGLEALIDEVKLMDSWRRDRPPLGRAIDRVASAFGARRTDAELREMLIERLEERLWASVDGDVIVITANWHTVQVATRLAEAAQQRFLRIRRAKELTEIRETIGILEQSLIELEPSIVEATRHMNTLARKYDTEIPRPVPVTSSTAVERAQHDLELRRARLREMEVGYLEDIRRARNRLAELSTTLGPQHPDFLDAKRTLANLEQPPAQLGSLRREVNAAMDRLDEARVASGVTVTIESPSIRRHPDLDQAVHAVRVLEDARAELRDRLANARIELSTAEAGFDFRYAVTLPAVPPRDPAAPKAPLVMLAPAVGGLLLGWLLAVVADLRCGRVLEAWQLEPALELPLLAEMKDP